MTSIRHRVRAVAFAWLLCQAASLAAFVPEQCCISHAAEEAAKEKAEACHEDAAPVAPKEGDACPMHQQGEGRSTHDCCIISNACDGPGGQLLGLFSLMGTIDEPIVSSVILDSTSAFVPPAPPLLHRLALPDAPPPKA